MAVVAEHCRHTPKPYFSGFAMSVTIVPKVGRNDSVIPLKIEQDGLCAAFKSCVLSCTRAQNYT